MCSMDKLSTHCLATIDHMQPRQPGQDMAPALAFEHRRSYMSAHILFILLNELGKRDKIRGLPSILSLFRSEF